jgi:hypothetical protein
MFRLTLWSLFLLSGLEKVSGAKGKLGEALPAAPSRYIVEFESQANVKIPMTVLVNRFAFRAKRLSDRHISVFPRLCR